MRVLARHYVRALFLIVFIGFLAGQVRAGIFERAAQLYNQGNYKSALALYQDAIDSGYSKSALYYNMGNCYFKLGDYVNAIYYYEKARFYSPLNKSLSKNLELAKAKADVVYTYNLEHDVFYFVSFYWLRALLLLFTAITLLLLTLSHWKRRVFFSAILFLLVCVFVWSAYIYKVNYYAKHSFGILVQPAILYAEPREEAEAVENLNAGSRVRIEERYGNFYKIKINNDLTGWVEKYRINKL